MARPAPATVSTPSLKDALLAGFAEQFRFAGGRFRRRKAGEPPDAAPFDRAGWRAAKREVMALHDVYTGGGAGQFAHDQNPIHAHQAGYQFYFLPRNMLRVRHVLEQLPWEGETMVARLAPLAGPTLPILDLGCGTGAFSLALLQWMSAGMGPGERLPPLHLTLVDQGHHLLELAEANVRALARRALPDAELTLETHAQGVESFLAGEGRGRRFTILGSAMVLNELHLLGPRRTEARSTRFATPLKGLVAERGVMVFVEPGTRKGYMHLMALRGQLQGLPILYPCPHARPCPMWNAKVTRWCHATVAVPRPFLFDPELQAVGLPFDMQALNLAGLAFQQSRAPAAPFAGSIGSRIVSSPMSARAKRGKHEVAPAPAPRIVLACGPDGKLSEVPAARLGGYPRGSWWDGRLPGGEIPAVDGDPTLRGGGDAAPVRHPRPPAARPRESSARGAPKRGKRWAGKR